MRNYAAGSVIGKANAPTSGVASGVWSLGAAGDAKRGSIWPSAGDSYFSSVSLLLHFDGSDASTTFTDSSGNAFSVTAVGNAQIDTAQSKFGGASGLFDGTGDYLSRADHAAFQFGTGDFTIEFWARFSATTAWQSFIQKSYVGATGGYQILMQNSTDLRLYINGAAVATDSSSISTNTWYHYAFVRSGSAVKIYRDGVEKASGTNSTNITNASTVLICGDDYGQEFQGWLDDFRITKGVARYTANFTPPIAAFPDY